MVLVSIFETKNIVEYLNGYLLGLPKQGHGESRRIAQALRVSSTFVSQVLGGTKMLTPEQAEVLSEYLGHSELEADFMFYLVQLDRAGTERLKGFCRKKLAGIKEQSLKLVNRVDPKKILSDEEKSIFYSSSIYSAIHLYTSTGSEDGRTLDEIIERFELTRARATEVVRFLKESGLVEDNDGRLSMSTQSTHVPEGSPHLLRHHANWRIKALQASESLSPKELMYTSNVSLSEKDFNVLREEMATFIKRFLDRVHASPAEEVACLNLDWFWIRK